MARRPQTKPSSERHKLILVGILSIVLLGIVLTSGSSDENEAAEMVTESARARRFPAKSVQQTAGGKAKTETQLSVKETPPPAVRSEALPRYDLDRLLATDPFSLVTAERPAESIALVAQPLDARPIMDLEHVQAVYVTPTGGSALVNGKVITIRDPARLISELKARRAAGNP